MRSAPHRSNQILIPSVDLEFCLRKICGGKGIRTPDLLIANETLYQLSYTPEIAGVMLTLPALFSRTLVNYPALSASRRSLLLHVVNLDEADTDGVVLAADDGRVRSGLEV